MPVKKVKRRAVRKPKRGRGSSSEEAKQLIRMTASMGGPLLLNAVKSHPLVSILGNMFSLGNGKKGRGIKTAVYMPPPFYGF